MTFERFPLVIGWETTLSCNLLCQHCGSSAGQPRRNELTTQEALSICDQFPDLLVHEVIFTGGEPLLREDWQQIAAYLGDLDIKTKLITNGKLLSPEVISQLQDAGIARLGVSVDGLEATHNLIRKDRGLFTHIMNSIEKALGSGLPVTVLTTVNSLNIKELPALASLLQSLEVDVWQIQPVFATGRARKTDEFLLSKAEYVQLGEFIKNYMVSDQALPSLMPGDSFGYYTELDQRQPAWAGCSAGLDLVGITSDGRIKGCLSMPDSLIEADLRQQSLWDIWFDPNLFSYNRKFSEAELGQNCLDCSYGEKCRGGCSTMSYSCTNLFHNDPYCFHKIKSL